MAVLDAERDLFNGRREYSTARYSYLFNTLRLKRAAGLLHQDDLQSISSMLTNETSQQFIYLPLRSKQPEIDEFISSFPRK